MTKPPGRVTRLITYGLDGVIVAGAWLIHGVTGSSLTLLTTQTVIPLDWLATGLVAAVWAVTLLLACYFMGGVLLTSFFEWRSMSRPDNAHVARTIYRSVAPAGALACVLGIGILSVPQALTMYGGALLVLLALLGVNWLLWREGLTGTGGTFHLPRALTGTAVVVICLLLPFVFLVKISPSTPISQGPGWAIIAALPRWAHLVLMSVALTSLIMAWRLGDPHGSLAAKLQTPTPQELRRGILRVALVALVLEFVIAPGLLMTMQYPYMSPSMGVFMALGMLTTVIGMVMLSASVNTTTANLGRFLPHVTTLLIVAMLATLLTRHFYRDKAMTSGAKLTQAQQSLDPDDDPSVMAMPGRSLYIANCKACHGNPSLAPSLGEIQSIYHHDPDGIVRWATHPGRKRAQYGAMPPMGYLHADRLNLIAQFMLASGKLSNEHEKPTTKP